MAPCCNNIVTPKMIRTGQVRIGDRIRLDAPQAEEESKVVSAPAPEAVQASSPEVMKTDVPENVQTAVPAAAVPESAPEPDSVPVQASVTPTQQSMYQQPMYQQPMYQQPVQQMQQNYRRMDSIRYSEMTPYLNGVQMQAAGNLPDSTSVVLPQSPMTGHDLSQRIDINDMQAFSGFLSTQIGRYMRVEQLIGSNIVEDRFGYLVGIGSNFIILQEITTGNIMVLDLFTIRMTYIYYSQPIFPESATL